MNGRAQKPKNKGAGAFLAPNGKMVEIRDVWADNLDEEMALIRKVQHTRAIRTFVRCRSCDQKCKCESLRVMLCLQVIVVELGGDWSPVASARPLFCLFCPVYISLFLSFSSTSISS